MSIRPAASFMRQTCPECLLYARFWDEEFICFISQLDINNPESLGDEFFHSLLNIHCSSGHIFEDLFVQKQNRFKESVTSSAAGKLWGCPNLWFFLNISQATWVWSTHSMKPAYWNVTFKHHTLTNKWWGLTNTRCGVLKVNWGLLSPRRWNRYTVLHSSH